ncbi:MAG TPA: LUD domain-containing protein [Saprospiraceae bacterium]|jgi:L-lactate dehydrogenase complex protein LldG|nr:MAG: lactate utilization protein B/C [Candidatus Parvibacillus calidus]MBX2937038.1 LUD domain-containing protein [Saprospiraceae bacterium]MBX7180186.1 LUD domain-containing protein [Saprospiraceae bacterium]MCB0589692.1 LUD domain-containing protein [Saprospiraceae bacterium]MCC7148505.1 LUD domain-containing protein [Saprospiraceae bacterium]
MENNARNIILKAVNLANEGLVRPDLPDPHIDSTTYDDAVTRFITVLEDIGGKAVRVATMEEVHTGVASMFDLSGMRVFSAGFEQGRFELPLETSIGPRRYSDIGLLITTSDLGVAENGAIWLDESKVPDRILPFIAENLVVILSGDAIVHNMHHAYDKLGEAAVGFGVFIAGPSKTADIEQSLVLGAHGARTMTVFIVGA